MVCSVSKPLRMHVFLMQFHQVFLRSHQGAETERNYRILAYIGRIQL